MDIKSHVGYKNQMDPTVQRWLAEARRTGRAEAGPVHRPCARYRWQVPVSVDVESPGQPAASMRAYTRDISATGLGLSCRRPLEVGAVIRVKPAAWGGAVDAIVRHCCPHLGEYRVGTEFICRGADGDVRAA